MSRDEVAATVVENAFLASIMPGRNAARPAPAHDVHLVLLGGAVASFLPRRRLLFSTSATEGALQGLWPRLLPPTPKGAILAASRKFHPTSFLSTVSCSPAVLRAASRLDPFWSNLPETCPGSKTPKCPQTLIGELLAKPRIRSPKPQQYANKLHWRVPAQSQAPEYTSLSPRNPRLPKL